jgi:hypothetical protein
MKNESSDKVREVYMKMSRSNRNNETRYQTIKRFWGIFCDIVMGSKNKPEQK